jgi:predicted PurR-regulated permease PerM
MLTLKFKGNPLMSTQRQVMFWGVFFVLLVLFLWVFSSVLLPFVLGAAIAYLLDPLADRLERMGCSRIAATTILTLLAVLILSLAILLIVPPLAQQLVQLFTSLKVYLPDTLQRVFGLSDADLQNLSEALSGDLSGNISTFVNFDAARSFVEQNASIMAAIISQIFNQGAVLISALSVLFVTPVVAFYWLNDWDRMVQVIDTNLPRRQAPVIRLLAARIDTVLGSFLRGQFVVALILGCFYAISLSLVGLNFGLVIGSVAGLISFIPYVGALVGFVSAVGVALVQFWNEPLWILVVAAIFLSGQFFEGNILQPKLVGKAVGLHPVALMFALFAFGSLFGFLGVLLAVPAAAAIGVLFRYVMDRYRQSALYKGHRSSHSQIHEEEQKALLSPAQSN